MRRWSNAEARRWRSNERILGNLSASLYAGAIRDTSTAGVASIPSKGCFLSPFFGSIYPYSDGYHKMEADFGGRSRYIAAPFYCGEKNATKEKE